MKPVLIVENSTNSLIKESAAKNDYILGGIFTEFGVKNRNERIYTADKNLIIQMFLTLHYLELLT
jgi:hypothetical protein